MRRTSKYVSALVSLGLWFPICALAQGTQSTDQTATKKMDRIHFANDYAGKSGTEKQDAAISDLGAGPGIVVSGPGTGQGNATTYRNNVPVLDLRQTSDIIGNSTTDPDRPPMILLENHLGDFTTKPLTGTVILTRGSTEVRGSGTRFLTELAHHYGRSIKLNADDPAAWTQIGTVTSDTQATLKAPYNGTGCSGGSCTVGDASYFITELGFAVRNVATAGIPNTMSGGESVGFTVVSNRTGGERGLYGANFNVSYSTPPSRSQGQAMALEIDLNNNTGHDDTSDMLTYGIYAVSGGKNHPDTGIVVASSSPADSWLRGAVLKGWSEVGMYVQGARDHLRLYTGAPPNPDPQIGGRNQTDTAYLWSINNDGSAGFSGKVKANQGITSDGALPITAGGTNQSIVLTPSGSGVISAASFISLHSLQVGALPRPSPENAGEMARVNDSTEVSAEGQSCVGGSTHTALAFSDGTKWKCF